MDYNTFISTVKLALQEKMGDGYHLAIRPIPKNNGVLLDGLTIQPPMSQIAPTIYLNPYYEQYQEGMSIDEILSDIQNLVQNSTPPSSICPEDIIDFAKMKSRIMMRLVHADSNRELLSDIPHIPYLDLAVVFYLFLERNAAGQMTSLIHNDYLGRWHLTSQGLLRLALANTPQAYPAEITSITEVMKKIARQNLGDRHDEGHLDRLLAENEAASPLYVLTNHTGIYGACCMLYQNVLKDFAGYLGKDLVVIPSSIHEVLLTPDTGEVSYSQLNSLVADINHYEVPVEDQLSNHIYVYTRSDGRVRIIT